MGERDNYAPGTFCWADIGTNDADAAKAFYTSVFGMEVVAREPLANAAFLRLARSGAHSGTAASSPPFFCPYPLRFRPGLACQAGYAEQEA